jgi:hypothetical protein
LVPFAVAAKDVASETMAYYVTELEDVMPFRIPTFILDVNIWRRTVAVTATPSISTNGNLVLGSRSATTPRDFETSTQHVTAMHLLLPALTDIRPYNLYQGDWLEDVVEVPAGSGRYYYVTDVDDVAKGFGNEYRHATITQVTYATINDANTLPFQNNQPPIWPAPIP